jgi:hypothetical protein
VRERVKEQFALEKRLRGDPGWLARLGTTTYWDPVELKGLTKLGKTDQGAPEEIKCVNVTRSHAVATTSSGDLWCWGKNTKGQLGVSGDLTAHQHVPAFAADFAEDHDKVAVGSVAVGRNHSCLVLQQARGAVLCHMHTRETPQRERTLSLPSFPVQLASQCCTS